jgi:hypothetical protein
MYVKDNHNSNHSTDMNSSDKPQSDNLNIETQISLDPQ